MGLPEDPTGLYRGTVRLLELDADLAAQRPASPWRSSADWTATAWVHLVPRGPACSTRARPGTWPGSSPTRSPTWPGTPPPGRRRTHPVRLPAGRARPGSRGPDHGADPAAVADVYLAHAHPGGHAFHGLSQDDRGSTSSS
ncbi:hypothetical protein LT493_15395 [Streptomyces tricolor]|nr:hypothetical protein [Streptomyces tricolor]